MKFKPNLILFLFYFLCLGCKTINYNGKEFKKHKTLKVIESNLNLNKMENDQITKNDTIVIETYKALVGSVKKEKIKTHLDSFFLKKYDSKKLIIALKMEQYIKKSGGKFEFNDSINPNNAYHVNSIEEFDSIRKLIFKKFKPKIKVKIDSTKIDSLKTKKQ
ncbi:MAG: hypothetical protein ACJAZK_001679 [Psychroserpens sp.]|jgi:hypothetical protein